jgi:hypothetical protein
MMVCEKKKINGSNLHGKFDCFDHAHFLTDLQIGEIRDKELDIHDELNTQITILV